MRTPRALPPDLEQMNDARAKWAESAIRSFMRTTGTDAGDAIGDLLGDLRHLCDRKPDTYGRWTTATERARDYYRDETAPD